ncbi:MAG: hypothetical protein LBL05_05190 [Synergistaceae bacterium]|jgi:hypothetical protein|nr:hypothetical protein [Synergistaceae bacterium]
MFKEIVGKIVAFVKQVEVEFAGKTGAEKRAALIKLVCGAIDIPFVPAWIENIFKPMAVGTIFDAIFKFINACTNGHIEAFPVTPDTTAALAEAARKEISGVAKGEAPVEIPVEKTAEVPNISDVNAKFDALVKEKLST